MKRAYFLACLLVAGLVLGASAAGAANPNVFLAMGCGITYGSVYDITPWPARLDSMLGSGKTVINAGKAASRVGYGVSKVDEYLNYYQPGYLLVLYGSNDLGVGNSVSYIIEQLRYMIRAAKGNYTVPVIGTIPPIFNGNVSYSAQNSLNAAIRQLAAAEGIRCADVAAAFNYKSSLIMPDGLHPTSDGQKLIAKVFYNAILVSARPVTPSATLATQFLLVNNQAQPQAVAVNAPAGYVWAATKADAWITLTAGSGTGSGTLRFNVAAHAGEIPRTAAIMVDSKKLTVRQLGSGVNLALASRGSTISGSNGASWGALIDGVITGYSASSGYGYTFWTGVSGAPGKIVLDLKSYCTVRGTSLLLWDLDSRTQRFLIEYSPDGVNWATLVNRTAGAYTGWQDMVLPAPVQARYLRLTGTYNSANNYFAAVEWEVYGVPGLAFTPAGQVFDPPAANSTIAVTAPVGYAWTAVATANWMRVTSGSPGSGSGTVAYQVDQNTQAGSRTATIAIDGQPFTVTQRGTYGNLALAAMGSTITGSNGKRAEQLIDGVTTGYVPTNGHGFTYWRNAPGAPGFFLLDVKKACRVDRIRMLIYDKDGRYVRYRIEASLDNATWTTIVNRTSGNYAGWQDITLPAAVDARYFRLTGTYSTVNDIFPVVEWEVYGSPLPPDPIRKAGAAPGGPAVILARTLLPLDIQVSSSATEPADPWTLVDADLETAWTGCAGEPGWWVVLAYDPAVTVRDVEVAFDGAAPGGIQMLISDDAETWTDLGEVLEAGSAEFNYLWLLIPGDGSGVAPRIAEITLVE